MDPEFQEIEDTLKGLRPVAPDAACLDRLLAAVEGRSQKSDPSLDAIERALAGIRPMALSEESSGSLLETVSQVPFPVDEKVVLFPGSAKPVSKKAPARRSWMAAAAAVAVAGAFSAVMFDGTKAPATGTVAGKSPSIPTREPKGFVPAAVGSGFQDASDEGVRWTRDGKPVRMVRVIYKDKVKYQNERGEIIEVERPRVEYLIVPEKID